MSIRDDEKDFKDYKIKAEAEPDPKPNSAIWDDDPCKRDEGYHFKRKRKKSPLKKKRKKR
jgi:hypothetical protein